MVTDRRMDICDSRVAFATEKSVVLVLLYRQSAYAWIGHRNTLGLWGLAMEGFSYSKEILPHFWPKTHARNMHFHFLICSSLTLLCTDTHWLVSRGNFSSVPVSVLTSGHQWPVCLWSYKHVSCVTWSIGPWFLSNNQERKSSNSCMSNLKQII